MSAPSRSLAVALDPSLRKLGFKRSGVTWNRRTGPLVDVVNIQTAKGGGDVFVNLGVAEDSIFLNRWERPLPNVVDEANCAARIRLGTLVTGADMSWDPLDPDAAQDIVARLESLGFAFLESMHDPATMAEFAKARPGLVPVEMLTVALVLNRAGDPAGACAILARLAPPGTRDALVERLRGLLGCQPL
jgi:Domain of unknown function (DUF4304)